jgi:hypothetical protein
MTWWPRQNLGSRAIGENGRARRADPAAPESFTAARNYTMRISVNTQAAPLFAERMILERLQGLSRRPDGKVLRRILIEDAAHQPRISIETFTPSEEAGIRRLLEDADFRDRAAKLDGTTGAGVVSPRRAGASSANDVFDAVYRHVEH